MVEGRTGPLSARSRSLALGAFAGSGLAGLPGLAALSGLFGLAGLSGLPGLFGLAGLPGLLELSAQEVTVSASVSTDTVALGTPFDLHIVVRGGGGVDRMPAVTPSFASLRGTSTQSSMRLGPGGRETTLQLTYRLVPTVEGSFDLGPFEVSVDGTVYLTEVLVVTISEGAGDAQSAPPGGAGRAPGSEATRAGQPGSELFLTATASKDAVYEGEPLIIEYRLWTELPVVSLSVTETPDPPGFWVEDVSPEGDLEAVGRNWNGREYTTAVVRRLALLPSGSGARTIEPLQLEASVRRPTSFGFFGASRTERVSIASDEVDLRVDPLPAGTPASYSGVVGHLELTASLDRDSVEANDAVTLTLAATGVGNIGQLQPPDLGLAADIEVFPPEVSDRTHATQTGLAGTKEFQFVLVPRAPGRGQIPPIVLHYLDDATGEYRSAATSTMPLTVTGEAPPVGGVRGGISTLREDIRFIHIEEHSLVPSGVRVFATPWFWVVLLGPLAAVAAAAGVGRSRARLAGDVAYARDKRARRIARKRFGDAQALVGGDAKRFYAEADRALRELVANRLNLAEAGLRTSELASALEATGVRAGLVERVVAALERCDRERFAPSGADEVERSEFLADLGGLISELDGELRR